MRKRTASLSAGLGALALALAGCGQGVAKGGENAAEHPSLGIFVPTTVGAGNMSGHPLPSAPVSIPSSKAPSPLPAGLAATVSALESALTGGCWQDSHSGNVYGAYDQLFWWDTQCAGTPGDQVTVELYPSAAKAAAAEHHSSPDATEARYVDGAVLVDVYSTSSSTVLAELAAVKGLSPVAGYGS